MTTAPLRTRGAPKSSCLCRRLLGALEGVAALLREPGERELHHKQAAR